MRFVVLAVFFLFFSIVVIMLIINPIKLFPNSITPREQLETFINANLKQFYLPSVDSVEKKVLTSSGKIDLYSFNWKINNTRFFAGAYYNEEGNLKENVIFISGLLDLTNSLSNVEKYFVEKVTNWECKISSFIICETLVIDGNSAKNIIGLKVSGNKSFVFICERPFGSEYYDLDDCKV